MTKRKRKGTSAATLPDDVADLLAQGLRPVAPENADRIRSRVLERIRGGPADYHTVRSGEGRWHAIAPRVECKQVYDDGESASYFLRLQPGARLPAHTHTRDELCVVLEGAVRLGDLEVGTGDFHLARAGSAHGEIVSVGGALLFLRGACAAHSHP